MSMSMTMTDGGATPKAGKKNMLAKLSKHKVVDPFEEEERIMLENMQAGISTLIDMHNMAELSSLCGTIGPAVMLLRPQSSAAAAGDCTLNDAVRTHVRVSLARSLTPGRV